MKKLICAKEVEECAEHGQKVMYIDADTLITPSARDAASNAGIEFCEGSAPQSDCGCGTVQNDQACCGDLNSGIDREVIYNALKTLMNKGMLGGVMNAIGQDVPYVSESDMGGAVKLVHSETAKWMPLFEEGDLVNKVFYNELINADDKSQINAGFITIDNCSFPWKTECQEIYYIVEGTLHVTKGDRVFVGNPGDVVFFEKGADLTFGSPNKVKAFYATH